MRTGWADKELAAVLEVNEHKASQSYMPALTKIARLFRLDAGRTMRDLAWASEGLPPMSDAEIDLMERIKMGRADHSELGQRPAACRSACSGPAKRCAGRQS